MEVTVFAFTAFASYWYETELPLFLGSGLIMFFFLYRWYEELRNAWPPDYCKGSRLILGCLPVASFAVILISLLTFASYDVVGVWILFYLVLGYAWIHGGVALMECGLDLFCMDDTIYRNNQAGIFPVAGGFLGLTLIYAGANSGDGPGWWVILIAGGLGLFSWIALAWLINKCTGISEHITVDRNVGCGIRFGAYLLSSGLIFGMASGGDWTSFHDTCVEFQVGWPVIPLALLVILTEFILMRHKKTDIDTGLTTSFGNSIPFSLLLGCFYLVYAVTCFLILSPLGANLPMGIAGVKL